MSNQPSHAPRFLRRARVSAATCLARSTLYEQMAKGLFVRPVRLSTRAVGWPANEVEALVSARVAGKTDAEIRELVKNLESARASASSACEVRT